MMVLGWVVGFLMIISVIQANSDSQEASKIARRMVDSESTLHFNSLNPDGTPVSFLEYYVSSDSCPGLQSVSDNGNPILFLSTMSTSYKNWNQRDNISLAIETYRKRHFENAFNQPRANLYGKLHNLTLSDSEQDKLIRCFTRKHPDAHRWLPGHREPIIHDTIWVEFNVESLYFVGGFGDRSYIGTISGDEYHSGIHELYSDHGHFNRATDDSKSRKFFWSLLKNFIKTALIKY